VSGRASGRKKQRHVSIADEKNRPTQQMLDIHRKDVKWTFLSTGSRMLVLDFSHKSDYTSTDLSWIQITGDEIDGGLGNERVSGPISVALTYFLQLISLH
jgi:hypothetical protein